jgi:hypothetical protein
MQYFIRTIDEILISLIVKRKQIVSKDISTSKSKSKKFIRPLIKLPNDTFLAYGYFVSPEMIQRKIKSKHF